MLGLDYKIGQKIGFKTNSPRKNMMHKNSFKIHYNGF